MTKRILVVEDQEDLRGVLRTLLTGSGYEMIEAADGQAGVEKAKSERPTSFSWTSRCRFSTAMTPRGRSRLTPISRRRPIIAVSSFAMKGDEEKARAAGCDHYVTKPYSPVQLLRIIRGFLGDKL